MWQKEDVQKEDKKNFLNAKANMPLLINEISNVLNEYPNGRTFQVPLDDEIIFLDNNSLVGDIKELNSKLRILEELGFIKEEYSTNCLLYR